MVTGATAVAWAAVAVILVIAGLGMATLAGGLPGAGSGEPAGPSRGMVGKPVALIAVHGALAATTILLVALAAIGAG